MHIRCNGGGLGWRSHAAATTRRHALTEVSPGWMVCGGSLGETGWLYKCLSRWKTPMMGRLRRTPTRRTTTSNEVMALLVRVKDLGVESGGRS